MTLNSVIFDIDDTIYDQMQPFSQACSHFLALKGIDWIKLYERRSVRGMEALRKMNDGSFTLEENHIYRMTMACRDLNIPFSSEEALAFQKIYEKSQKALQPTDNMVKIFEYCKNKNCFLGIITNGPSDHQREKFRTLGLDSWFSPAYFLASGDCGWLKPDIRIFQLAADQWSLNPEHTIYIGDSLEHDIAGASAAGWHTFWLRRRICKKPYEELTPCGNENDLFDYLVETTESRP